MLRPRQGLQASKKSWRCAAGEQLAVRGVVVCFTTFGALPHRSTSVSQKTCAVRWRRSAIKPWLARSNYVTCVVPTAGVKRLRG